MYFQQQDDFKLPQWLDFQSNRPETQPKLQSEYHSCISPPVDAMPINQSIKK